MIVLKEKTRNKNDLHDNVFYNGCVKNKFKISSSSRY